MNWLVVLAALSAAGSTSVNARARPGTNPLPPSVSQQRAAIARQRDSIRQQAANASVWMLPEPDSTAVTFPSEPAPVCEPIPDNTVAPVIQGAAKASGVEEKLIRAVIEKESAFRPCAVSAKGAQGLMQLMPDTAHELQVTNPFDPEQNIQAGAKYLKQLLDRFKGDLPKALAAYNAGAGAVDQARGIPEIDETKAYVEAILGRLGSGGKE